MHLADQGGLEGRAGRFPSGRWMGGKQELLGASEPCKVP